MKHYSLLSILVCLALLTSCGRLPKGKVSHEDVVNELHDLSFTVRNERAQTQFVTCFYWGRMSELSTWRWHRSDIYRLEPGEEATVHIKRFTSARDRAEVYGWLAVFDDYATANATSWPEVPDSRKLALNRLELLKTFNNGKLTEQEVVLIGERYGANHQMLDFRLVPRGEKEKKTAEDLNFWVENNTDELIFATCFSLGNRLGHDLWQFEESQILELAPGDIKLVDVSEMETKRDTAETRGYLALYRCKPGTDAVANREQARSSFAGLLERLQHESEARARAQTATFELPHDDQMLYLSQIIKLHHKVIVLSKEQSGVQVDHNGITQTSFIEYTIKPFAAFDAARGAS